MSASRRQKIENIKAKLIDQEGDVQIHICRNCQRHCNPLLKEIISDSLLSIRYGYLK